MQFIYLKYLGKTEFKDVSKYLDTNKNIEVFCFKVDGYQYTKQYSTARKAAVELDKKRILLGLKPINIFVKV